jgi:DNA gyrase subunit A
MHVANLLAFQPDEKIAQVMYLRDYAVAPYLLLATRGGQVKKTPLGEYDSARQGGVIAINLREDDEVIGALLVSPTDDVLLVSRKAMSIRFTADDDALRPMGRATGGVRGMNLKDDDAVLSLALVRPGSDLVVATANGYVKRTDVDEYRVQQRGGYGTQAARTTDDRGELVGALIVVEGEQLFVITSNGGVLRTVITTVTLRRTGRATMGVRLIDVADGDSVVAIARNAEDSVDEDSETEAGSAEPEQPEAGVEGDARPVGSDDHGGAEGGAADQEG